MHVRIHAYNGRDEFYMCTHAACTSALLGYVNVCVCMHSCTPDTQTVSTCGLSVLLACISEVFLLYMVIERFDVKGYLFMLSGCATCVFILVAMATGMFNLI